MALQAFARIIGSYGSPLVPHGTLQGRVDGDRALQIQGRYEATSLDHKFEGAGEHGEGGRDVAHAAGVPGRRSPTTFRNGGRDGPRRSPEGTRHKFPFFISVAQNSRALQAFARTISSYSSPLVPHGTLKGHVDGDRVSFQILGRYEATNFDHKFEGAATGDAISGVVELGWEYGQAKWRARRA